MNAYHSTTFGRDGFQNDAIFLDRATILETQYQTHEFDAHHIASTNGILENIKKIKTNQLMFRHTRRGRSTRKRSTLNAYFLFTSKAHR